MARPEQHQARGPRQEAVAGTGVRLSASPELMADIYAWLAVAAVADRELHRVAGTDILAG